MKYGLWSLMIVAILAPALLALAVKFYVELRSPFCPSGSPPLPKSQAPAPNQPKNYKN